MWTPCAAGEQAEQQGHSLCSQRRRCCCRHCPLLQRPLPSLQPQACSAGGAVQGDTCEGPVARTAPRCPWPAAPWPGRQWRTARWRPPGRSPAQSAPSWLRQQGVGGGEGRGGVGEGWWEAGWGGGLARAHTTAGCAALPTTTGQQAAEPAGPQRPPCVIASTVPGTSISVWTPCRVADNGINGCSSQQPFRWLKAGPAHSPGTRAAVSHRPWGPPRAPTCTAAAPLAAGVP